MMKHRKRYRKRTVEDTSSDLSQTELAAGSNGFGVPPDVAERDARVVHLLTDRLLSDDQTILDYKLQGLSDADIALALDKPKAWVRKRKDYIAFLYDAIRLELCCD